IVGFLLNWGLFGTLSVQLYLYYLAFPNDRRFTKYLVYGIYVIESAQTMFIAHDMFARFGYGFGDIDALTKTDFNWLTVPIMGAVVACVGQVFYAYRIFVVSKSRIIPILVICVSLTSFVAAIITGVYCFQAGNVTKENNRKMYITAGVCNGLDVPKFVGLNHLMRRTTNFRRTRILVTKIIRLTIETGSVTAVVALLAFILFIAFPHQPFRAALALLMPKLYANAVYMALNSRFKIIGGRDTYQSSMDMSITTTIIRNITSSQSTDVADGQVIMSSEVFNEMAQMNISSRIST
ncbi:hypothetical protein ARMGADRAFT_946688, partial [Armillaria gallica]